ncbi:hypothetical protein NPS29_26245, partial [Pseudomonas putida]|nr:hypothetical protein [Pseudomonas putida]
ATALPALPVGSQSAPPNVLELNYHDESLTPLAGAAYIALFEDGTVRQGILDERGHARLEAVPAQSAKVYFGEDAQAHAARVPLPENKFHAESTTNEQAEEQLQDYLNRVDQLWQAQTSSAQREASAQLNPPSDADTGESLWLYLDDAQQAALRDKLKGEQS